jgi:transposase
MDEVLQTSGLGESAHTTGRKSARSARVEMITRGDRRRSWTLEQKREIVAESLGPELTPTEVARKHAISSGQLYTWRQQLLSMPGTVIERAIPRFAAVDLAPASPGASEPAPIGGTVPAEPATPARTGGTIEIVLPNGISLRVDAEVDGGALCRVLDAVARR